MQCSYVLVDCLHFWSLHTGVQYARYLQVQKPVCMCVREEYDGLADSGCGLYNDAMSCAILCSVSTGLTRWKWSIIFLSQFSMQILL